MIRVGDNYCLIGGSGFLKCCDKIICIIGFEKKIFFVILIYFYID